MNINKTSMLPILIPHTSAINTSIINTSIIETFRDSYVNIFNKQTRQFLAFEVSDFSNTPRFLNTIDKDFEHKFLLKKYNDKYTLKIFGQYFCLDHLSADLCLIDFLSLSISLPISLALDTGYNIVNSDGDCLDISKTKTKKCLSSKENENNIFGVQFSRKRGKCPVLEAETEYKEPDVEIQKVLRKYPALQSKPRARNWFKSMWNMAKRPKFKRPRFHMEKGMPKMRWPRLFC